MTTPVIGHRSVEFVYLYKLIQTHLQKLFYTQDPVFISTSSAWGVMEGSIRNLTLKKVLNCMCGAFSDKWHDVSERCGKKTGSVKSDWGQVIDPQEVHHALSSGQYDTITLVHNETSTGTMNPLKEIMEVVKEFPEVISIVDTVSSFSALPILKDDLGIDVMITSSQKALALPPGLSLFSVSERAFDRATKLRNRGYYFDFLEFLRNHEKGMTPSTPNITLVYALHSKLEEKFKEGMENRYLRHKNLNDKVHNWIKKNEFKLFPEKKYASVTLSCIENNRNIDLDMLNNLLKRRYNCIIDQGYGKIRGKTFRISNMGDETDDTISNLLNNLDSILHEMN